MTNIRKCSVCGSDKCYKIDAFSNNRKRYGEVAGKATNKRGIFNYQYSTTKQVGINVEISTNIDSYVCKECGHIEFYANDLLTKVEKDEQYYTDKVKVLDAELNVAKDNINRFTEDYKAALDEYNLYMFNNPYDGCKNEISYQLRVNDFNDKLRSIRTEIEYETLKIDKLEKLLADYNYLLDNVFNIKLR
jgi:hypothetical protein